MENKFRKFIIDNKGFVVFYLLWFLLHLIFVSIGDGDSRFFPFGHNSELLDDYGFTEFLFYLVIPIVIWALWKLVGKDVNKILDNNN